VRKRLKSHIARANPSGVVPCHGNLPNPGTDGQMRRDMREDLVALLRISGESR